MDKIDKKVVAGIDDATKCPCIGSIFVSGVSASPYMIRKWKQLGVRDSKLIARKKRDRLAEIIKQTAVSYAVYEITPAQMADDDYNLNDWEMLTVLDIAGKLNGRIEKVIIDNWEVNKTVFFQRLNILFEQAEQLKIKSKGFDFDPQTLKRLKLIPKHRADEKHVIVGAASILSKAGSDRQYDCYRRKYGDFGSGSPADPKTRFFVWKHRQEPLPIIRTSWKTYKDIKPLARIEDDWICGRIKNKANFLTK